MEKKVKLQLFKPEIIPIAMVAADLNTTPPIIKAAIENGSLPIGFVGGHRTVIIKRRYEQWVKGVDLGLLLGGVTKFDFSGNKEKN
jgi:hypothetical protein